MSLLDRQPPLAEGSIRGRIVQEVVELLPLTPRNEGGEHRHGLVVLPREEQADEVVPENLADSAAVEETVDPGYQEGVLPPP